MKLKRHRTVRRALMLALVAVLVVGCSDGRVALREQANEEVEMLGEALADAVLLSYQAAEGRIEPEAGTRAAGETRRLTQQLNETTSILDADAQALAVQLLDVTNQALTRIAQTEYEVAEKLRLEEFIPIANELAALPLDPDAEPVTAPTGWWTTGKAMAVLAGIAAGGILLAVRYWSGDVPDPVVEAERRRAERSGLPVGPIERTWSEIPELVSQPAVSEVDETQTTRTRPIEFDLDRLLMTALHQIKDYGWDMSIVCPKLRIVADPVKLRYAVLAALGNAFFGGAQRAGIVVEDLEGDVLMTIGRDAPPDQGDAAEATEQFARQIAIALGVDEVESALIIDDDVALMSVSLGVRVGADEVSEPVA